MLLAGDEFGRTQRGNNNAYCQDNEISWVDWNGRTERDLMFGRFVKAILRMRREHPAFERDRVLHRPARSPAARARTSRGTRPPAPR